MKNSFLFLISVLTFIGCQSDSSQIVKTLIFSNDIDSKVVNIHNKDLKDTDKPFIIKANGKEVPYQLIDAGFGKEVLLLTSFKTGEKVNFTQEFVEKKPSYQNRVAITFAEKKPPHQNCYDALRIKPTDSNKASDLFQMEGPAWENDLVGFRNYYDQRNTIDIFGKQVSDMVLAKAGIDGQNYHELDNWGMDILKVGTSLGAGGIALQVKDSIYRISNPASSHFQLLENGPLRASFILNHKDFSAGGNLYQIKHKITILAGTNFYESEVTISGLKGKEKLVTGIVNLHSTELHLLENTEEGTFIIATHDKQAEDGAMLGMAISVPKSAYHFKQELPKENADLTNTYAIFLKIRNNQPVKFKFISAWETQDKKMGDEKYFLESLTK